MAISEQGAARYLTDCDPALKLDGPNLDKACHQLNRICAYNGGRINFDVDLPDEMAADYYRQTVDEAITMVCSRYAKSLEYTRPQLSLAEASFSVPHQLLRPISVKPAVDINTATAKELTSLPGIGPMLADRIIAYKQQHGRFKGVDDMERVSGIGEVIVRRIEPEVWFSQGGNNEFVLSAPLLTAFSENPCFQTYLPLIRQLGVRFKLWGRISDSSTEPPQDCEYEQMVVSELKTIADYVQRNRWQPPVVDASKVKSLMERKKSVATISAQDCADVEGVSLLNGRRYRLFMSNLLPTASSEIWVSMFYMNLNPDSLAGAGELLQMLVDAKSRGVDVRVILDQDRLDRVHGSNAVNAEAIAFLREHEIPIGLDAGELRTHTKTVIIDDRFLIVGNHNWTPGSFFSYDDKSLFIASRQLCTKAKDEFMMRWRRFGENGGMKHV